MGKNMLYWHEATKLAKYGILALPKPTVSPRVTTVDFVQEVFRRRQKNVTCLNPKYNDSNNY
jgi:hypothetical protein